MRSSRRRWPPASVTATVTAMPASRARATAVSSTLRAPAGVRRFESATYMCDLLEIYYAMPITRIQHFLVTSDDIDATRDWYARVLCLRSGPHPELFLHDPNVVKIEPNYP